METKIKKLIAIILTLFLCNGTCLAADWPHNLTNGQEALRSYIDRVNADLVSLGAETVNSIFEIYTYSATLGVTVFSDAPMPEGTELAFTLTRERLQQLVLRTTDIDSFAKLAASCVHASTDEDIALQEYMTEPEKYVKAVRKSPEKSFSQTVISAQGDRVRTYYAYYPNQYHDGANWLQLTLIFSLSGYSSGIDAASSPKSSNENQEYAGYLPTDDGDHFQVFATATPEPDSPAGEELWH